MDAETETRLMVAELGQRNPAADPALIDRLVRQRFEAYADAKIAAFVPVLVRREVRSQLAGTTSSPVVGRKVTRPSGR
jgi:hypothetical protein